jgi:hypothetical protein
MRVVNEIWIITSSGITLFNLSKDEKIDPLLFGGFFSAIQSFAQTLGESTLKTLVIGNAKLTVYQGKKGFLFVSRSPQKIKDDSIIDYLKLVETKFFEQYEMILDKPIQDTNIFKNFGDVIHEIFEDTPEKRAAKALW